MRVSENNIKAKLASYSKPQMPVDKVTIVLNVVKDKTVPGKPKDQRNLYMSIHSEEGTNQLQSSEDFETLVSYIHTAYTDYMVPTLLYCGTKGNTVALDAKIDDMFCFEDDTFIVSFVVPIPKDIKEKGQWITYVLSSSKYKNLAKLYANFVGFEVDVRVHVVQSITFKFSFKMGSRNQGVKSIFENQTNTTTPLIPTNQLAECSEEEMRAFWFNAFNEFQQNTQNRNQHTFKLEANVIETNVEGQRMMALEYKQEDVKIKF